MDYSTFSDSDLSKVISGLKKQLAAAKQEQGKRRQAAPKPAPKKETRGLSENAVKEIEETAADCKDWRDHDLNTLATKDSDYILLNAEEIRKKYGIKGLDLFLAGLGYSCFYGSGKHKITMLKQTLDDLCVSRIKCYQIKLIGGGIKY